VSLPVPNPAEHRQRLLAALGDDEAVLLVGAPHRTRSHDTEHRYRQQSDVWWLTGWPDPDVVVLIRPGQQPFTMFVQARDREQETWTGRRHGPEGAKARFGADVAWPIEDLDTQLPRLLQGVSTLHYAFGVDAAMDVRVQQAIGRAAKAARRNGLDVPETFASPARLIHELRLMKTESELALMRAAAAITAEAHVELMRMGRPGVNEHTLDAHLELAFRRSGGTGPGYTNIVAAGDNATILHYIENRDVIEDGELVLVDAGCEVAHYTADVTRTWPANGRFTPIQRAAYEHVLDAQRLCIEALRPGATWLAMHETAIRRLTEGMIDLGLLSGDVDDLIREEKFKKYYMHGTGHWLGIDVHDCGAYARGGRSREMAAGMVVTVEPGLYVPADDLEAPAELRGLGIRIEDDVLITPDGHEVLTAACPKSVADLEATCAR
jgi:Xaa-Pro aminopeptidase